MNRDIANPTKCHVRLRRLRSVAQSDQSLRSPYEKSIRAQASCRVPSKLWTECRVTWVLAGRTRGFVVLLLKYCLLLMSHFSHLSLHLPALPRSRVYKTFPVNTHILARLNGCLQNEPKLSFFILLHVQFHFQNTQLYCTRFYFAALRTSCSVFLNCTTLLKPY